MPGEATPITPLNPGVETSGPSDFTRNSQGYQADSSKGTLLKGAADVLEMGVKATDIYFKDTITESLRRETDAVKNQFGNQAAVNIQEAVLGKDAPAELRSSMRQIEDLHEARTQGRLKDSQYWARLDLIARQTRTRYPGYREHIDNTISQLVGTTPSNQLVRELMQESKIKAGQGINEAEKNQREWEEKNGVDIVAKYPTYFQDKAAGKPVPPFSQLKADVYTHQLGLKDIERRKAELSLNTATDEATNKKRFELISGAVSREMAMADEKLFSNVSGLQAKIREMTAKGEAIPPQLVEETRAGVNELVVKRAEKLNAILNSYDAPVTDKEKIRKFHVETGEVLLGSYTNGAYGTLEAIDNNNKALASGTKNVVQRDATLGAIKAIRDNFGDVAANELFVHENRVAKGKLLGEMRDVVQDAILKGTANKIPLTQTIRGMGVEADPKAREAVINIPAEVIMDSKADVRHREAQAERYFGTKAQTDSILDLVTDQNSKIKIYQKLTDPRMAVAMKELGQKNPGLYENWKTWTNQGFQNVYMSELSALQNVITTQNVDVSFEGGRFIAKTGIPNPGPNVPPNQSVEYRANENFVRTRLQPRLENLNKAIKGMEPVWKDQGVAVEDAVAAITNKYGLHKTGAPGTLESIADYVSQAVSRLKSNAVRSFSKPADAKLQLTMKDIEELSKEFGKATKDIADSKTTGLDNIAGVINFLEGRGIVITDRVSKNVEDARGARFANPALTGFNADTIEGSFPQPTGRAEDFGLTNPQEPPQLKGPIVEVTRRK